MGKKPRFRSLGEGCACIAEERPRINVISLIERLASGLGFGVSFASTICSDLTHCLIRCQPNNLLVDRKEEPL